MVGLDIQFLEKCPSLDVVLQSDNPGLVVDFQFLQNCPSLGLEQLLKFKRDSEFSGFGLSV